MEQDLSNKRSHVLIRGRGVTAAQQTFNLPGGGSNPPPSVPVKARHRPARRGSVPHAGGAGMLCRLLSDRIGNIPEES